MRIKKGKGDSNTSKGQTDWYIILEGLNTYIDIKRKQQIIYKSRSKFAELSAA